MFFIVSPKRYAAKIAGSVCMAADAGRISSNVSNMINVDVFSKIAPMTGLAVTTTKWHIDCFANNIDVSSLKSASDFMAGSAGVMNFRVGRSYRSTGWTANVSAMAANAPVRSDNFCSMVGSKFTKDILMTLNTVSRCGISKGGHMMNRACSQRERGNVTIITG